MVPPWPKLTEKDAITTSKCNKDHIDVQNILYDIFEV